jgi:predicted AlkP superfamily phosphohydrolase/phosphomutase
MRTVLFGVDGATFTVLDDLVARGVMPTLAGVYQDGCRARLASTPLPLTPQAWTSMATSRGAGHHGIHDFFRPQFTARGTYFHLNDSRDVHCEPVWQYASRHGRQVTVLNYIQCSPPPPVRGHIVPGFTSSRHLRRSTHPAGLIDRLGVDVKRLGLELHTEQQALQTMPAEQWPEWIRHHIDRERAWFDVLDRLMHEEPSDLTAIVFDGVDKIQHLAYRLLDPRLRPERMKSWELEALSLCDAYFRHLDGFLRSTLERLGRWGRLVLASDHGFTGSRFVFYVNKWLHDQGLLTWRGEVAEDQEQSLFGQTLGHLTNALDFDRTRAFALTPSSNGIYLRNVSGVECDALRQQIIRGLLELRGPDGQPVVTAVKTREECFPGPYCELAPDLTLTLADHGFISVLNAKEAVVARPEVAGTHHPDGVLLAVGPGIREGADAGRSDILDVAPMLVHSLGLPIPADYEGRFPTEFYDPSYLASDPARQATEDDEESAAVATVGASTAADSDPEEEACVMERLRSLGYIE